MGVGANAGKVNSNQIYQQGEVSLHVLLEKTKLHTDGVFVLGIFLQVFVYSTQFSICLTVRRTYSFSVKVSL